jgi:hypothetical protein
LFPQACCNGVAAASGTPERHCEERSDEAIQLPGTELDCFAPLAMTANSSIDSKTKSASEAS